MRRWKIVRWNGYQQEALIVEASDAYNALSLNPLGSYDMSVLSITEIPFHPTADTAAL